MRIHSRVLRLTGCLLALVALFTHTPARAQVEGTDYRVLSPSQPTESADKIEVIEFFSYGCPHCAEFAPIINTWVATLPKDVVFRRVPVGFDRPAWVNLERAYYSLVASGDIDRLDGPLFVAIHQEHLPLFDESALAQWVGKNGGNADKFASAYTSFGINNLTWQADRMAEVYQVSSVPTVVVEGKYIAMGNTFTEIVANAEKLVAKVRAERLPPKKK